MSLIDIHPPDPDARLREWVSQWPAKTVARDVGAEIRTVHSWRQGHWPAGQHFKAMVAAYGRSFLDYVFPEPTAAELQHEALVLACAQVELARLRRERARHAATSRIASVKGVAMGGRGGDAGWIDRAGERLPASVGAVAFQGGEG